MFELLVGLALSAIGYALRNACTKRLDVLESSFVDTIQDFNAMQKPPDPPIDVDCTVIRETRQLLPECSTTETRTDTEDICV